MNIFKTVANGITTVRNALSAPLPPPGGQQIGISRDADTQTRMALASRPQPSNLDDFQRKFTQPPYLLGHWRRDRSFAAVNPPIVGKKHFERILGELGEGIFSPSELKANAELLDKWRKLDEADSKLSFLALTSEFQRRNREATDQFLSGAPMQAASFHEHRAAIGAAKTELFRKRKEISSQLFPIYEAACKKISMAAREITALFDENDRDNFSDFEDASVAFQPSPRTLAFSYIAICLSFRPVQGFKTTGWLAPADISKDPLSLWLPAVPTAAQIGYRPVPRERGEIAPAQPILAKSELAAAQAEKESQARKVALEEKNRRIEEFKKSLAAQKTAAAAGLAEAEAARDLARQAAVERLKNPPAAAAPKEKSNDA